MRSKVICNILWYLFIFKTNGLRLERLVWGYGAAVWRPAEQLGELVLGLGELVLALLRWSELGHGIHEGADGLVQPSEAVPGGRVLGRRRRYPALDSATTSGPSLSRYRKASSAIRRGLAVALSGLDLSTLTHVSGSTVHDVFCVR
jgi:hypothetical protein